MSYARYSGLIGAASGVSSLNGETGALTLVAGTGISITPAGQNITIASTSAGDVAIGAFGSTPNANGLSISGSQVLNLQPADATHSGGLSFADWNTFNNKQSALTLTNLTDAGTDGITIGNGTGAVIGASPVTISQHVASASFNGYLSSTDWSTFNSKQSALTLGNFTEATSSVLTITGGTGAIIGSGLSVQVKLAATGQSGYLSSTDWNTFNGKQAAGNYITALTGGVTASGPGSAVATVVTNANLTGDVTSVGNASSYSATMPLNKGGTGQTTKAAAFDALQPMTAGGDIIYGGASGTGARLANGSAGQVLTSAGGTSAPTWSTFASQSVSAAKTTTYAILTTDNVVLVDGTSAAFSVTLPTAVGVSGKQYTVKRIDQTLANVVTLATTSSQTIDGVTTRKICTQYEQFTVVSDGSNWQITSHTYPSTWVEYTPTFTGFGAAASVHFSSRRVGDSLQIAGQFVVGTPTATQAEVTFGFGGTNANVTAINDTRLTSNSNLGTWINSGFGQAANAPILATVNANYMSFGLANGGSGTATAFRNGNDIVGAGNTVGVLMQVPIAGWEG